jgi:hypothetical protein
LVCFGLLSQTTIDCVVYKQEKFVSHSSRVWKVLNQSSEDSVSAEDLLPCSDMGVILLCPYIAEGAKEFSQVSFMWVTILIPFVKVEP